MALLDLATGELLPEAPEAATLLEPTADAAALAAAASGNAGPIAIRFPAFGDGRGISLAVLLRERHGFTGEIRAVGYLIPDLAQFLLRSGFDTAEIADPEQAATWKAALSRYSRNYQKGYRNLLPLRRDATRKEAGELDQRLARIKTPARPHQGDAPADRGPHRLLDQPRSGGPGDPARHRRIRHRRYRRVHPRHRTSVPRGARDGRACPSSVTACASASSRQRRARCRSSSPATACSASASAVENRKACCEIRKVRPLNRELKGAQGWIAGIRREHSADRAHVPLAAWDEAHALIKVNPVADWTSQELTAYIAANNVPVNPLHARGFVSIGCAPCTRAVQPGEDPRAGRWWWEHEDKKECGIHMNPNRKGKAA